MLSGVKMLTFNGKKKGRYVVSLRYKILVVMEKSFFIISSDVVNVLIFCHVKIDWDLNLSLHGGHHRLSVRLCFEDRACALVLSLERVTFQYSKMVGILGRRLISS